VGPTCCNNSGAAEGAERGKWGGCTWKVGPQFDGASNSLCRSVNG
jgi:hypothetical protein